MHEPTIGVIGTGHFASYLIAALRNGGHQGRILLSSHSPDKAAELAVKLRCEIAADHQALSADADWILIAVRPQRFNEALAALVFEPRHTILSAVGGVPLSELRRAAAGADVYVRIMPSSYVEFMTGGLIPIFPSVAAVERVLARAGTVMAMTSEDQFELSTVAACLSGWVYRFADNLTQWFVGKGMSGDQARQLVLGNLAGALALAEANPDLDLQAISDGIATEGTYTKAGLDMLTARHATTPWTDALDEIFEKIRAGEVISPNT